MNIKDNIGKITWSFLDKGTYMVFGFFILYQLKYLTTSDLAFFESMNIFNNWIFLIADGLALNGLIQFGAKEEEKPKVNLLSITTITAFIIIATVIIFFLRNQIADLFNETKFAIALFYLPIIALFTIPRNYTLKFLYRELKFRYIFFVNISFFMSQILATFYYIHKTGGLDFIKMIYILFIGAISASLISTILIFKKLKFSTKGDTTLKEFLRFGFVVTNQQIFHSIPKSFDFYLISGFFGSSMAGIYGAAKKLFKTFDEAASAAHGLIYPAVIKQLGQNNRTAFKAVMTKSISALLFVFTLIIIILNFGLTDFVLNIFKLDKFLVASDLFNSMVISGLFIPFALLAPILNATNNEKYALKYNQYAFLIWLISILLICFSGNFTLTPISIVLYYSTLGILCFAFMNKNYDFRFKEIFRFFKDVKSAFDN